MARKPMTDKARIRRLENRLTQAENRAVNIKSKLDALWDVYASVCKRIENLEDGKQ